MFPGTFSAPVSVDSAPNNGWVGVASLDFTSPTVGATSAALDGNDAANRTVFASTVLSGVSLNPGDQIFIRWLDIDDSGSDHGLGVDDFTASFSVVPEPSSAALAALAMLGLSIWRRSRC